MASVAPGADQISFPGQRVRVSISQQVISPAGEEGRVGERFVAVEKALAMPCIKVEMFS